MKIVLFINGNLGLRILDYVSDLRDCELVSIILNNDKKRTPIYLGEVESLLRAKNRDLPILKWSQEFLQSAELDSLFKGVNFGVSALFGHILPKEIIGKFPGGILNLHPSLLPIGRGADPIPWGIIERQKQGITLHLIDNDLDSGGIIFQKEIPTDSTMNAGDIYDSAMSEMFIEFSRLFTSWINGEIQAKPQSKSPQSHHKASDLEAMKMIKDNEIGTFGEFIRRIQATSFSNGSLPKYTDSQGNIWEIATKITKTFNNEQKWR
jgi:methionyl-tRNA formyltransferase